MHVVIPTHKGDADLAIHLAKQIKEQGGAASHTARLVASKTVPAEKVSILREELEKSFRRVDVHIVEAYEIKDPMAPSPSLHTPAANSMFRECVKIVESSGVEGPWLLLEPDSTILKKGWLEKLEDAYLQARADGKFIVAGRIPLRAYSFHIQAAKPPLRGVERALVSVVDSQHETYSPPVMVYPSKLTPLTKLFVASKYEPWEVTSRWEIVRHSSPTKLIAHALESRKWKQSGDKFTFETKEQDKGPRERDLSEAVLVHGTKDATLWDMFAPKTKPVTSKNV